MGACTFAVTAEGKDAKNAFNKAQEEARYMYGNSGYTGTIAEKPNFIKIVCPADKKPMDYADELLDSEDPRVDDKWGAAGCIQISKNTFLFFGWASE